VALEDVSIFGYGIDATAALVASLIAGILWELLYWVCVDRSESGNPSWIDWAWWAVGSGIGAAVAALK